MSPGELAQLLEESSELLELNAKMATPAVLGLAEKTIDRLRKNTVLVTTLATLLDSDLNAILSALTSAELAVDMERKLTQGKLTERLLAVLRTIRNSPLALHLIAPLIRKEN